jgi:seryl-tRNA synthetase
MLDIQFIRDNPELVRQAAEHKQLNPNIVDEVLRLDEQRRTLIQHVEVFRRQVNDNADQIKVQVHGGGRPAPDLVEKGRQLKEQLRDLEPQLKQAEETFRDLMLQVPNVPATDVPIGPDESGNQIVRQVGELPTFAFEPKQHQELMENLDMLDTKQAVEIGGFRSYFLKNDGLLLERALLNYALDLMIEQGFTPMSAPVLVNREAMTGTGYFPWGQEDHYYTQDDQILAGTAEVALTSYYMGKTLTEKDLPIKMVGVSPCFRREIGSYGKDTQGIVRVHQFNKVEQVLYTVADETVTRDWHEKITSISETLLTNLGLPYQVLVMCTGDMGAGQRKKYDIETWFPGQQKYRETHSASYFNDFQARRLNIRYQSKEGDLKYVYTMNNTVAASPRLLAAIIENYQQADGSIQVPTVLQSYMHKTMISG